MEKKKIKKYAAAGVLAATITSGVGLAIYDANVDHTHELCPITHILNVAPNLSYFDWGTYLPTGVALHQWWELEKDYAEKGIEDVQISYGKITEEVIERVSPISEIREDGTIIRTAPEGYVLTSDGNGYPICQKIVDIDQGYGLTTTWGEMTYDEYNNEVIFENKEVLKVRK